MFHLRRPVHLALCTGLLATSAVAVAGSAGAAPGDSITVPGTANIFAAAMASTPALPGGGGTVPPAVDVTAGSRLAVTATGLVDCGTGSVSGPDGGTGGGTVIIQSYGGIAGANIPGGSSCGLALVGVFTGLAAPSTPPPARLDFVAPPGTGFTTLSPGLNQAFFIGDGAIGTGSGSAQEFTVPAGATKLWLGFQDGQSYSSPPGYYGDNGGALSVAVRRVTELYGGTPIDVVSRKAGQSTDGACTAGFAVRRVSTGALYMVTAGHCRDILNRLGRPSGTANPVDVYPAGDRTTPYASLVNCDGKDFGCLVTNQKPTDMFAWAPDSAVPSARVLVGDSYRPVVGTMAPTAGQQVCWTGRGTAREACAVVSGNSIKDKANRALLRALRGPGYVSIHGDRIVRGDSGSLVYIKSDAGVYAVGMAVIGSGNEYSGILPVRTIEESLGVSVITGA